MIQKFELVISKIKKIIHHTTNPLIIGSKKTLAIGNLLLALNFRSENMNLN
jgi:hypothetical protein